MFGYVKPLTPELRIREYECYRAYYCGVCRAMGSCTGQCSRMTLSYDFVFLAAVRCYLAGETPEVEKIRCIAHPLRRRKAVKTSPQLAYCADASALLSYQKCKDDRIDEKGLKRLRARFAMLFLSSAYRRAKKRHPELDERIALELDRLHEYEQNATEPSADAPAAIFGSLMEAVFEEGLDGSARRIAAKLGQTVGKWIYLVDAAEDFESDKKHGRFNPYLKMWGASPTPQDRQMILTALTSILMEAEQAFLLMEDPPAPELYEILANILYLGLPEIAKHKVLGCPKKKRSKTEKGDQT